MAAVVPTCGERFFFVYNLGWEAFTFPMTKRNTSSAQPPEDEPWIDAARRAAAEILVPAAQPAELTLRCEFANYLQSDRDGAWKRYRFHVYDLHQ